MPRVKKQDAAPETVKSSAKSTQKTKPVKSSQTRSSQGGPAQASQPSPKRSKADSSVASESLIPESLTPKSLTPEPLKLQQVTAKPAPKKPASAKSAPKKPVSAKKAISKPAEKPVLDAPAPDYVPDAQAVQVKPGTTKQPSPKPPSPKQTSTRAKKSVVTSVIGVDDAAVGGIAEAKPKPKKQPAATQNTETKASPQAETVTPEKPISNQSISNQPISKKRTASTAQKAKAVAPASADPAASSSKRTRQAKVKAVPVGEALPEPATTQPVAEPVILEVPKPRRGKKKATEAPLPAVLEGVEAVSVTAQGAAAQEPPLRTGITVTHAPHETLADFPTALDEGDAPLPPAPDTRKSRKVKLAGSPAKTTSAVTAPESVPAEADEADKAQASPRPVSLRPEQDIVVAQLRKLGRPVHVRDLEKTFTRSTLERLGGWRNLNDLLEDLVAAGQVIRTRKKTYGLPEAMSLVRGRFQASASGFGFVIPDSGGEDYYVSADRTMEAWNGDTVLVRMEGRGDSRDQRGGPRRGQKGDGNPRASVVRIVQRAYKQLVGTLEFSHGHPILKPDDHRARHRILLLPEGLEDLEAGARVVTKLFWPENTGEDEVFGQVARVLGAEDDPQTETEAVIVKYHLHGEFPENVLEQTMAIPATIPEEVLVGRLDLRDFNIFTVDGRDAKDFDDAIHIQPTPDGTFVVGVHIADVSHYVHEETPLDDEAYERATSVYLPGRVLPMLPEHLSNGVCSLVPHEDRLTMTALVELSAEGEILGVQLVPSVINSKARLTYDEVQAYSEAIATLPEHARQLEGDLHLLLKITTKLRQKRLREGSLDFKLREVKVDVGPDGRMELIPIREETARGMIEDLMLLANKVVAHYLLERQIPTLFRIHEEPTLQRFQEVSGAIGRLGLAFPGGNPSPQAYQAVLKQVRGTGRESVVNTLLLRSMQQAKYAGENLGHFGLAFKEYLHFTSPIRRYPDLVVHRTLKAVLNGSFKAGNGAVAAFQAKLPGMGDHTSDCERRAAEAERDLTKYYQCKWAQEHLGESFTGNVSGVVASGLYVALDNGVEGKLHISYLDDDYYVFIEDAQMLKGRRAGHSFRLGDPVNITIQAVKPLARQIDLVLADPTDPAYKLGSTGEPGMTEKPGSAALSANTVPLQENHMDSAIKPRARRREDREAEHREKLQAVQVSPPKKFTLEDETPAIQTSPQSARPRGGYQRQGNRSAAVNGSNNRSGRQDASRQDGGRQDGGRQGGGPRRSSGTPRRVITLERPRNEHLRPVNITVQRMYFGDWTLENLPPDEGHSQARAGRERGYTRQERGESRSWTRGSNDRGAVQNVNGQSPSGRPKTAQAPQAARGEAVASTQPTSTAQAEEAKRRRRRRGRRPGSGEGNGTE